MLGARAGPAGRVDSVGQVYLHLSKQGILVQFLPGLLVGEGRFSFTGWRQVDCPVFR